MYIQNVRNIQNANLLAFWPLYGTSGSTANDQSGNNYDGSIPGGTLGQTGIGDGETSFLFDGINDYVDVYSTGFRDAFNALLLNCTQNAEEP